MNRTRKGTRVDQHTTGQMCTLRASHTHTHARPLMRGKIRAREVSHNAFFFFIKKHYQNIATLRGIQYKHKTTTSIEIRQAYNSQKTVT